MTGTSGDLARTVGTIPDICEASLRLARTRAWDGDVSRLRFARGSRAEALERLGVESVRDALLHIPHRYLDFTRITKVAQADVGAEVTCVGVIDKVTLKRPRPRLQIVEVALIDETGVLMCAFFKQPWLTDQLHHGDTLAVSGKVTFAYGFKQMTPQFHEVVAREGEAASPSAFARLLPVHSVSEGLTPAWMRRIESAALADWGDAGDFMPARLVAARGLMTEARAIREAHFPCGSHAAERARRRFAYDELLCLQAALLARRQIELAGLSAHAHVTSGSHVEALLAALPFELTGEQRAAADEILADMAAAAPMNRLLLGDVGTGKTAVAAVAIAAVADSGTQAAVMAPTSVLARQYAEKLGPVFDAANITWALVTGSTPPAERASTAVSLAAGDTCVLFGTTAVLGADLAFADLSLVVVDEQHRFGVGQRSRLRSKGVAPDQLTMTATPIPRTLALILYGDLDISIIDELPPGRKPIDTSAVDSRYHERIYAFLQKEVAQGRQVYVICPMIEENEKPEVQSVLQYAAELAERLPELRIACVHGKLKPKEKQAVMTAFAAGEVDVLVATTVIEVGVNVPNASVMLIENAERFGLAQLHQLRGRVGRGSEKSYCILVSDSKAKVARERLKIMTKCEDGFLLSEKDLQLRGPGEFFGIRQHGLPELKIADLSRDLPILKEAQKAAAELLARDGELREEEHGLLRERIGGYLEGKLLEI